jgi:hypothetical protein
MSNRFDSIKNKPHSMVVTSKMKVLREFKRIQDELQVSFQSPNIIVNQLATSGARANYLVNRATNWVQWIHA